MNKCNRPVSVPWFWLAYVIAYLLKDELIKGKVVDSQTGKTRINLELSGNILGDGRTHLPVVN